MTNPITENLCPGCFVDKGRANPCPHCGYDEQAARGPLVLPHHTLLHGCYQIGRVLGKPGGFGITYLAWDQQLHTRVAIKEYLPRELAGRDPDKSTIAAHSGEDAELFRYGLDQFLCEARTLAQLDHPNIVRVRQFFQANGTAYLVMDYYDGLSLAEYLDQQGGKLPEQAAVQLMMPILDGLRAVHARGFLHRDVKPQNIYLAKTDTGGTRPILLDFGAARQAMGERSRSLSVVVSAGYAPFEQYQRKGQQGPWSDVYSAAAVLYRAVTGQEPPEAMERIPDDILQPATAFGVSQALSVALGKALTVKPDERPSDIQSFQELIRGCEEPNAEVEESPPITEKESNNSRPKASNTTKTQHKSSTGWIYAVGLFGLIILLLVFTQNWVTQEPSQFEKAMNAMDAEDYEIALTLLRPLADQGDAEAQNALGLAYDLGNGVAVDHVEAVKWYRKAADQGLAVAEFNLGSMYDGGEGVRKDHAEAAKWYRKAADQGLAVAQYSLGLMFEAGDSVEEDDTEAVKWFRKAAEQDDPDAQNMLGRMYEEGDGVGKDDAEAVKWYRRAAEQGLAAAQYNLAWMYDEGNGIRLDDAEAVAWYRKAADQGHAFAQHALGLMYEAGEGVGEDDVEAVKWFRKAAEQDDPDAQNMLGRMHEEGDGVRKDNAEAVEWYRKAADQGLAVAQFNLGRMYYEGHGVRKDYAEAVSLYRKAADQDIAVAQYYVGLMYQSGEGVGKDDAEAVKWFRKAAEQNDPDAQNMLGLMYDEGRGVRIDDAEAVKWYRKAADQGLAIAQHHMGMMYQAGEGVRQNDVEAKRWYQKSADQGYEDAKTALRELTR